MAAAAELTEAEAAVYDRQLRVWGVEVQRKLTSSRILIVGADGLGAEVAKNLVLAGVGALTVMDDRPRASAPPGNFLVPHDADATTVAAASAATLAEMNPLVKVSAAPAWRAGEPLSGFDVAVLCGASIPEQLALNAACRAGGVKFFGARCAGGRGAIFMDLLRHTCVAPKPAAEAGASSSAAAAAKAPEVHEFCPLEAALGAPLGALAKAKWPHPGVFLWRAVAAAERGAGRALAPGDAALLAEAAAALRASEGVPAAKLPEGAAAEYAALAGDASPAVAAVLGGVLAQEVLKAVSGSGLPVGNCFFFDPATGGGAAVPLGYAPPEAAAAAAGGGGGGAVEVAL